MLYNRCKEVAYIKNVPYVFQIVSGKTIGNEVASIQQKENKLRKILILFKKTRGATPKIYHVIFTWITYLKVNHKKINEL